MKHRIILIFLAFVVNITAIAQKNNPYQFNVTGLKDSTVYLANYYGERLYYADTAKADKNGNFSFKRVEKKKEGKFAVVLPGPKYFEIIIADGEDIKMQTDTADLVFNMKVEKSENNRVMFDYMRFLSAKRIERDKLLKELEENEGKPEVTARLKTRYNELNDEVSTYQKELFIKYPNLFSVKEIKMSVDIEPPVELHADRDKAYQYYKQHYFDNIDLSDDRVVNTPIFHTKLVTYLNKTLIQDPDTIIQNFRKLSVRLPKGSEVYKYTVHYTTYNFETSKIMGMDKVFVYMVDNFYKGEDAFWMDEEKLKSIREKANNKRYTLIGMKAPELILADTAGTWISTYRDIKTKYTLLYFYDPDCGHCKKETPKLVEMAQNYKGDLAIYAVSADNDDKWNKFIRDNKMTFYNVSIPRDAYKDADYATGLITSGKTTYQSLKYHETFDVFSTPKIILLDANKIIKAKDIGVEQIPDIINRLDEMQLK
jgi:peroxiredoxin